MDTKVYILFSGGARGAEAAFGANAERLGIEEVNFTFEGHSIVRDRGIRMLNHEELEKGDVSLSYVSRLMNRNYTQTAVFRKILQSIWYQINDGQEIYVIGQIMEDNTVRGGTGWGAEFAKICNKPLYVFDQEQDGWYVWREDKWVAEVEPRIEHRHFTGTGTRILKDNSEKAIAQLFDRSFS